IVQSQARLCKCIHFCFAITNTIAATASAVAAIICSFPSFHDTTAGACHRWKFWNVYVLLLTLDEFLSIQLRQRRKNGSLLPADVNSGARNGLWWLNAIHPDLTLLRDVAISALHRRRTKHIQQCFAVA
ncbi:hypothetical protein CYMTET_26571, partial [Cymbomonas tetramitiformis]